MRKSTALLLAAGLALLATAAAAQPRFMHGPPPGMDSGAGRVLALLLRPDTLSEAQEQQVHAIMEADRGTVHDTLDKLKSVNEQMAAALLADPAPTSEALAALTDEVTALRKTLVAQQVETALAVRAVLTPEQLADAEARRQQIAARAGDEAFPDQP